MTWAGIFGPPPDKVMLKYETTTASPLLITQVNTEPSVYLDHWALRQFSATQVLGDRLQAALMAQGGMLEISFLNVLEFSEVTDNSQILAVERLLDTLSPGHIGFVDAIPKSVIEKENKFLRGDRDVRDPHTDYQLLEVFASHKRDSLNPASFQDFFSNQIPEMQQMSRTFFSTMGTHLEAAKRKAARPEFTRIVRKTPKGHPAVQYLTRYIEIETVRYIVRESIRMTPNHWRDLYHMVVPLAYCDLILLDNAWAAIAEQVKARLRKAGHSKKMASVFSSRDLERFFETLERPPAMGSGEIVSEAYGSSH